MTRTYSASSTCGKPKETRALFIPVTHHRSNHTPVGHAAVRDIGDCRGSNLPGVNFSPEFTDSGPFGNDSYFEPKHWVTCNNKIVSRAMSRLAVDSHLSGIRAV